MPGPTAAPSLASAAAVASGPDGTGPKAHRWEDAAAGGSGAAGEATWDTAVQEDEEGNIVLAASLSKADRIRKRRQQLEQTDYAQRRKRVVRDMIRYLYVVVDASRWMRVKDPVLPPSTKIDVTLALLQEFVKEYYDQNPLSHLGFIICRSGEAEILSKLSSNSKSHNVALDALRVMIASENKTKGGEFSLQNGLEVAGRSLGHQPRHGSREIVVVVGALSTCDPGNVLTETLPRLQAANVRVSTLALSAELHVCRKLAEETIGIMGVCMDKTHFRDWLLGGQCTPPPKNTSSSSEKKGCEMVHMGFPERKSEDVMTLVHATRDTKVLARTAYVCPQCKAKQLQLPTDCPVCGLKLVLAPHLARSFHHLFPVPAFLELPMNVQLTVDANNNGSTDAPATKTLPRWNNSLVTNSKDNDRCCFACLKEIGIYQNKDNDSNTNKKKKKKQQPQQQTQQQQQGEDEILRFQCPDCLNVFCADCDAFLHDTLHNCPGCLLKQ